MRLAICTKLDIIGCSILNALLPRLAGHEVTVLLSEKTRPAEEQVAELAELKLLERDLPLSWMFPLLDASGDGVRSECLTFNGLAARHGVRLDVVGQINAGDGLAILESFRPDIVLSARFSLIFRHPSLSIPRHGIYNVHPGALPRYGGLFAPMRALSAGDEQLGCALHRIDEQIDTGPIVSVSWLPVRRDRSLFWHTANLYPLGLEQFLRLLALVKEGGSVPLQVQDLSRREYRGMPTAEDFARFRATGMLLVAPRDYMEFLAPFAPVKSHKAIAEWSAGARRSLGVAK